MGKESIEVKEKKDKEPQSTKTDRQKVVLSAERAAEYEEAIKSAKRKFDHTLFAKNWKG